MKLELPKNKKKHTFPPKDWETQVNTHWKISLCILGVCVLGSLGFGIYSFLQENNSTDTIPYSSTSPVKEGISHERIQKILDIFTIRQQTSSDVLNKPVTFPDPSL